MENPFICDIMEQMKDIQEQPEKDLIPYRCGICGGENIQQAESQLWDLNKEMIIENSQYLEDFYWCPDCDKESYLMGEGWNPLTS